jgi:S1-C subfamily serine protease
MREPVCNETRRGTVFRIQCDFIEFYSDIPYDHTRDDRKVGTGFLLQVGSRRVIMTAHHVVSDAIRVLCLTPAFEDGEARPLRLLGCNPHLDLAVLDGDGLEDLPAFTPGTSRSLCPRQQVVCLGYAGGSLHEHTTSGTVSGHQDWPHNRIQTDTTINPGNSGGPVLHATTGHVVGVVTSAMDDMQGTNFFTGMDETLFSVRRMFQSGRRTVDLGMELSAIVTSVDAAACGGAPGGALVTAAPCDSALRQGDVIRAVTAADGRTLLALDAHMRVRSDHGWTHNPIDFRGILDCFPGGPRMQWTIKVRRDGTDRLVNVEVGPSRIRTRSLHPDCEPVEYVAWGGLVIQMMSQTHMDTQVYTSKCVDPLFLLNSYPIITHVSTGSPYATHSGVTLDGRAVRRVIHPDKPPTVVHTLEDLVRAIKTTPLGLDLDTGQRVGCSAETLREYEESVQSTPALSRGLHCVSLGLD